jgi:hypothetical protein
LWCETWCLDVSIKSQGYKFSQSNQINGAYWNGSASGLASGFQGGLKAYDLGDTIGPGSGSPLVVLDEVTGQPIQIIVSNGLIGQQAAPPGTLPSNGNILQDETTGSFYSVVVSNGIIGINPTTAQTGQRQYQIAGCSTTIDTLTFIGQAKLRYAYATSVSTIVLPDNFPALLAAVRAFHFQDVGDETRAESYFAKALALLESGSAEIVENEDMGSLSLDPMTSGGSILNIC